MTQFQGTGAEGSVGSELHVRCVDLRLTHGAGNHSLQGLPKASLEARSHSRLCSEPVPAGVSWGEAAGFPCLWLHESRLCLYQFRQVQSLIHTACFPKATLVIKFNYTLGTVGYSLFIYRKHSVASLQDMQIASITTIG